jgi:hypothetical protein
LIFNAVDQQAALRKFSGEQPLKPDDLSPSTTQRDR